MIKNIVDQILVEDAQSMRNQLQNLEQRKRNVMDKASKSGTSPDAKVTAQDQAREIDAKLKSVRDRLTIEQRKPPQQRSMHTNFEDEDEYDEPILENSKGSGSVYDRVLKRLKGNK